MSNANINNEDKMEKTIIINGVEITAYHKGLGISLKLVKDGSIKLDSPVACVNLSRIIRPETLPQVKSLIAEVEASSAAEIAAAVAAKAAQYAAEDVDNEIPGYKTIYDRKTPFGRTVRDDATTRAMAI